MRKGIFLTLIFLSVFLLQKSLAQTYITNCTTITQPGEYVLVNDISYSSGCFDIQTDNVTLDCQGHIVEAYIGVSVGYHSNITIKNCVFNNQHSSVYSSYSSIYIYNSRLRGGYYGVYLDRGSAYITSSSLSGFNAYIAYFDIANSSIDQIYLYWSSGNFSNITTNYIDINGGSYNFSNMFVTGGGVHTIYEGWSVSAGMFIDTYGVTISDSTFFNISGYGVFLYGAGGVNITNSSFISNGVGVCFGDYAYDNTVSNSKFILNNVGIMIKSPSGGNLLFNNLFNNTNNWAVWQTPSVLIYFNTTLQPGPNIVGGPYIGGNYWGSPDGTGYSDICSDINKDGFCDEPYNLTHTYTLPGLTVSVPIGVDYLPLTTYHPPTTTTIPPVTAVSCRICEPSQIDNYAWRGLCLFGNYVMCNPFFLVIIIILGIIVTLVSKLIPS